MRSLQQVIAELRREIESALEQEYSLPAGARLEADRVVLTLQVGIKAHDEMDKKIVVLNQDEPNPASFAHSLTIEFKCRGVLPGQTVNSKQEVAGFRRPMDATETQQVIEQLSAVFGPPGFDSSARATVFREALENVSDTEIETLIGALAGKSETKQNAAVKKSVSLLNRVFRSGPAGLVKANSIVADILRRHPVKSVAQLVNETWKAQQDWMN